ncbi:hypothetical protein ACFP2T_47800 [Plantactinospora solaniradicis]|uniref:Uncharacterized protein n=1 Tax=Plantactinospora solaniradicis TaxID=1723736 RepID=A0ABW1KQH1_9ACTN
MITSAGVTFSVRQRPLKEATGRGSAHGRGTALELRQHIGQLVLDSAPGVVGPPRRLAAGALDLRDQAQRPPCAGLLKDPDAVPLTVDLDDGQKILWSDFTR